MNHAQGHESREQSSGYLHLSQVNDGPDVSEEIHPDNSLYLEAIIHRADFNLEPAGLKVTYGQPVSRLVNTNSAPPNSSSAMRYNG